ncbi:type VI secretion system tip protein TssI/VgrG [Haloferula sp. BvORR071]|uniref:type VI secretion system Vgr family protein n=1 Tax=Haloferula sp. BvORR071 TaxID=1396141 RepID=UPI00054DD873|nr:type VI secretion system tip protein TssI/VgrG [Haloferula sp. BvORR071]
MPETQQDRRLKLTTPLGEDVLMITRFNGEEELSKTYRYELDLVSTDPKVKFDDIVGQNVTVKVEAEKSGTRIFNGFVSEFQQMEPRDQLARYRAIVVPWFWYLTRVADCRIFQQKSIPEIIEAVFSSRNFSQYELRLSGSYKPLEYCVQYRETDFNFVSRLMEQEGICYYFTHKDGEHTMVLADAPSAHDPCPNCESANYYPWNLGIDFSGIRSWVREGRVCPGAFAHTDFDFKSPGKKLLADTSNPKQHDHADYEIYDYPGEYIDRGAGSNYATIRMQELQARHETHRGEADIAGLQVGFQFELKEAFRDDDNRKYLITRLHHDIHSTPFGSQEVSGGPRFYQVKLLAIPATVDYRPSRDTPKPLITGPQTAIVTGPGGDEIYTDEYSRVKVHFHWHRHDNSDDKSSCWIRVSQYWAGKQWGSIHIPRIGQEVIVEFLEGDPDRPIITGRVYNGDNMPPYGLPANKTQSGIKSRSSMGGGTSNFNEIRMEDKKGSEQLYIHAEKNQDNIVENDETTSVGHDRTEDVGHNETIHIHHDRTETVDNNETITIGVNRTETVGSNEVISIGVNRTETVGSNETITIGSAFTHTVGASETKTVAMMRTHTVGINEMINVGAAQEITVGGVQATTVGASQSNTIGTSQTNTIGSDQETSVGANQSTSVGKNQSFAVGDNRATDVGKDDTLKVGKKLAIDAGDQILIKTGDASILMKKDGTIQIKGKNITIEGSGQIQVKASKDVTVKGQKIMNN